MGTINYIWRIASDCPNNFITVHDKESVDPTLFRRAISFESVRPLRFVFHGKRSAFLGEDYIPNSAMLPLVSKAVALRLVDVAGSAIQSLPAVVLCGDGEFEATLLNPLEVVSAVDWNNSNVLYIPGTKQVMKFTKLALLPDALGKLDLARLAEFRSFILASERIKNLLAKAKLCEFVLPSEIRP
jgi:hypothetical protein